MAKVNSIYKRWSLRSPLGYKLQALRRGCISVSRSGAEINNLSPQSVCGIFI